MKRPRAVEHAVGLEDPTLLRCGGRCSFSHLVLECVQAHQPEVDVTEVFGHVYSWLMARRERSAVRPVNATIVRVTGVPLAYVFPRPHRHWPGMSIVELCASSFLDPAPTSVACSENAPREHATTPHGFLSRFSRCATSVKPPKPRRVNTKQRTIPAELAAVTVGQQEADIRRLCDVLELRREDWPVSASVDAGAPPQDDVVRRWVGLRAAARMRPYEIIRMLKWGVVQPGIWLVCCLANRLDGWVWEMTGEYPKESVSCIRRCLIATRGIVESDPLWQHARNILRRRRD